MKRFAPALLAIMITAPMAQAQAHTDLQRSDAAGASSWPAGSWEDRYCRGLTAAHVDPGIECPSNRLAPAIPAKFRTVMACKQIRDAIERDGAAGFFNLAHAYPERVIECVNTPEIKAW
ncbi:MAG: hypothetical protein NXH88_01675 [Hyphomonas sp.]|nr:hypothetical protein [Hyphomonas sp.]